jgi:hypothetical protein
MQNNDIHYSYEYYTSICIIFNDLKYIPFCYVEIICMSQQLGVLLHNAEF